MFSAFTSPNCKVSERSNEGIPRQRVVKGRTNERGLNSRFLQINIRRTKNGQNTDFNNQNVEFGGSLKSQRAAKNEFTHRNNELLCSRVSRYNLKHKGKLKT